MMNVRVKVRLWAVNVCRAILAGVLLVSGFVKLADPMGMVYKLQAYAAHWSVSVDDLWLKMLSVVIGALELQMGVYLLLGIRRRTSAWVTLLMMLAFLLLSIYLYIDGGIADCGCFGAMLELSPGETLIKNVCFTLMAIYIVTYPRRMRRLVTERNQGVATVYTVAYSFVLSLYSLHYLPLVTFTDYRVGENWAAQYHEGAQPARDGIVNLAMYNAEGEDVTTKVLSDSSACFMLTLPNVLLADDSSADRINDLYDYAHDNECSFVALVGDVSAYADWQDRTGASYEALSVDADVLKAMVRSTPGLLLLHQGVILGKWGTNNLPTTAEVKKVIARHKSGEMLDSNESMVWLRLVLFLAVPLLLLISIDGAWVGHKFRGHRKRMRQLLQLKEQDKQEETKD
jgi:triosephosphate isomerase